MARKNSMAAAAEQSARKAGPATTKPLDKTRFTVDLDTEFYQEVQQWAAEHFTDAGGRIEMTSLVRALLAELLGHQGDGFEAGVLDRIRQANTERRAARFGGRR